MTLLELLVEELPKRGGWPDGLKAIEQNVSGFLFNSLKPSKAFLFDKHGFEVTEKWRTEIVTLEQYEAALAASKPEWDGEGLPTVGVECQYETNGYGIKMVRVECITMDGIAFTWLGDDPKFNGLDCINIAQAHRFRPAISGAEKKRAEGVIALSRVDPQAMPFEYGDKHSDGSLIGPFWYELYDAIAAGKIPHIRID